MSDHTPSNDRPASSDRLPARFPRFESVEDERRHRKQRLAAAFRIFAERGFDEDHAIFEHYSGAVLELDEGKGIADALGSNKAVILANHGLLTVGQTSVDEAAWWFLAMDRACHAQLLAEAASTPVPIERRQAEKTKPQVGHRRVGWLSFQPLHQAIVTEQPNLLEE